MKRLFFVLMIAVFFSLIFVSAVTWDGEVYYNFNTSSATSVANVINNSQYNGTLYNMNAANFVAGKIGDGLEFDGSAESFNNTESYYISNDAFTISFWAEPDDVSVTEHKVMEATGNLDIIVKTITSKWQTYVGAAWVDIGTAEANVWQHIVLVYNGSQMNTYKNGVNSNNYTGTIVPVTSRQPVFGSDRTQNFYYDGMLDEIGIWNRSLTDAEVLQLWNSGDGISYGTGAAPPLVITLDSPEDDSVLSAVGSNFTANYTVTSSYNLTNVTYYVWNSTGVFNNSVFFWLNGTTNTTTSYIDDFTIGAYKWNAFVCYDDTSSVSACEFEATNFSFNVGALINDEYWENETYETAREVYQINITLFAGSTLHSVKLNYNGTNYTVSDIVNTAGDNYTFTKAIDVPLNFNSFANDTKTFYWNFVYVDDEEVQTSQTTTTNYQNNSFIVLNICNATYAQTAVNFTLTNELTSAEINGTTNHTDMEASFNYWMGSGSVMKNYSYKNLSANGTQFQFCISPVWESCYVDMDMEYGAVDFNPREHFFRNASLSNATNEVTLNLLTEAESIKFFIDLKLGINEFPNALVTISKLFVGEGVYRTIGIKETDGVGEFVEYLDLDKSYKFFVSKDGINYGTVTKTATCEEAPCELTLRLEEEEIDMWQGFYDVFAANIIYTLTYDDTLKLVTYVFNDLTGLAQYFRLEVNQMSYNQTGNNICDSSLYSTSGTLTCNLTGYEGDFRADAYVSRSPEQKVGYKHIFISLIKATLGSTGILLSLFIIITIALVGAWNPAVGVILVGFSVLMMKLLGFVAFGYTTVILVFIMAIILAVKMKT